MRFLLLLLPFTFLISSTTFAQLSIGLKGGVNSSFQKLEDKNVDYTIQTSSIIRYQLGLTVEKKLKNKLSFYADLCYNLQGGKYVMAFDQSVTTIAPNGQTIVQRLDYIGVSAMLQFTPIKRWSIDAGLMSNFLIDQELQILSANTKLDIGLNMGVTFQVFEGLDFQFRYYLGLTEALRYQLYDQDGGLKHDLTFKNRSVQFSLVQTLN